MRDTEREEMKSPIKLSFFLYFTLSSVASAQSSNHLIQTQIPIGVILNLGSLVGKIGRTSIEMAMEDFYVSNKNYGTRLVLHIRDSNGDVLQATSAALEFLQKTKTVAIIGPQKSSEAIIVSEICNKSQVPVISFSATSPTLSSMHLPFFIKATINDAAQVYSITALIKTYGWREVVPIYEDTNFGRDIVPYLVDALNNIDVSIPYRSMISESSSDDQIKKELYKLQTMQTRVFIVNMTPSKGSSLFLNAKEVGMMSKGYVWILTNGLTNVLDSLNPHVISAMQGALGVRQYIPKTKDLENFAIRWTKKFQEGSPKDEPCEISAFTLWAYDTIHVLAAAVEKIWIQNANFSLQFPIDQNYSMHLPVFPDGPKLLNAISNSKFRGMSGNFELKDGQLQYSLFEIINLAKEGIREIGYWRLGMQGLTRQLVDNNDQNYLSLPSDLNLVTWPGNSHIIPKGWEIPVSGRKLRVGVIRGSFAEFITVDKDPRTNEIRASGYSVDVFEAAVKKLPYAVPYEYELFGLVTKQSSLTYNDFVYQVFLQKYDVAIGDITIRYNRTIYADFSMPYTDSGVAMIVPVKEATNRNSLIFLKPLTADLWFACLAFFIYTGIVILLLEPKMRAAVRGSISGHLGTIVHLSLFASQQKLESILSKIVVIVWVFVLLVLTSSYTASLSSMLTVQQLQPTVTDVHDLIKNGDYVGYGQGSFIEGLLQELGFEKSKMRSYDFQNYAEALEKGNANGGVAAIVDETPYLKFFIAKHCQSYTMVEIYKSEGFGFAFPKGSSLISDISTAILNITGGPEMIQIEKKWIRDENCQNIGSIIESNTLSFFSFWGLFLTTGVVSTVSLLTSTMISLCKKQKNMINIVSLETSSDETDDVEALPSTNQEADIFNATSEGNPESSPENNQQ